MGNCIICGTSTDGPICEVHQEDVVFEFDGDHPNQLTEGRFYRGTVDGYADFGVFVDLSPSVTGLLHRSKIDRRLESLDWESGDTVFVQVNNVRDNGDIDLGWSIRQDEREFRGVLIDSPEGDRLADEEEAATETSATETTDRTGRADQPSQQDRAGQSDGASGAEPSSRSESSSQADNPGRTDDAGRTETRGGGEPDEEPEQAGEPSRSSTENPQEATLQAATSGSADAAAGDSPAEPAEAESRNEAAAETAAEPERDYERVEIGTLEDRVGENVRIEGEVVSARQTSGPTVFELRDETGVVDCAAFEEAGVRAYPEVETGDLVRLDGEVRVRRDELQVETEALIVLEDEERGAVEDRMAEALADEAAAELEPLVEDPAVEAVHDELDGIATTIRRAVLESRPIVVRHAATADGYVAGAAIERAVLPLVREEHQGTDAVYHYFDRRPLEDGVYDMEDATKDVTRMLDNRERHDEKLPLYVFAAAGSTRGSLDGIEFLDVYGAEVAVVDGVGIDESVADVAGTVAGADGERTATTLAANVAVGVNEDVRGDLLHLPAVSYWDSTPEEYADIAAAGDVDEEAARRLREAIALEAFYQRYEDKRELIIDLLFDQQHGLAEQVSGQFREKLSAEIETAEANLERRSVDGVEVAVLDTESYTHKYDFPPAELLLDELFRRHRSETPVVVGYGTDELHIRATGDLDVDAVAEAAREDAPNAGIAARGARTGQVGFLSGEREAAVDAVIERAVDRL